MQKINVTSVIVRHLDTLRGDDGRLMTSDVCTFYALPILFGCGVFVLDWRVPKDAIELSVTVFSIFAALLLSVQVALYSVSLRPLSPPEDPKKKTAFEGLAAVRTIVIRELNDNIAYLILLAIVWVSVLLALYVLRCLGRFPSALVVVMYAHFFLTLLMVVKRAGIVFSREYESND